MSRGLHPGLAPASHAPDGINFRSDMANRWVLAELKRRAQARPMPQRVPDLQLVELPDRAWTKPAKPRPQTGRQHPDIAYRRTHSTARALCRVLPFIVPLVRRIF